ncbi:hypothetical protein ABID39_000117 [Bartonella japonica]|uniref:Uncharacterized protein n=1 Tax=Bartonella japonica TaxID=357761 RepID=A0ABV2FLM7_9HYPH
MQGKLKKSSQKRLFVVSMIVCQQEENSALVKITLLCSRAFCYFCFQAEGDGFTSLEHMYYLEDLTIIFYRFFLYSVSFFLCYSNAR